MGRQRRLQAGRMPEFVCTQNAQRTAENGAQTQQHIAEIAWRRAVVCGKRYPNLGEFMVVQSIRSQCHGRGRLLWWNQRSSSICRLTRCRTAVWVIRTHASPSIEIVRAGLGLHQAGDDQGKSDRQIESVNNALRFSTTHTWL